METHTIPARSPQWRAILHNFDRVDEGMLPGDLFFRGDLSGLLDEGHPRVLILGTRSPSAADIHLIEYVVSLLAENPVRPVLLSGLGIGTDMVAQLAAVRDGLRSVAVLPCGLGQIYPHCNEDLAGRISSLEGSALVSQFPDGTLPEPLRFLERTRTLVLMSDLVVIPAAREKGAAIVAARLAASIGVPVFAVPGDPMYPTRQGCNALIEEGSARLLRKVESLREWHL